MRNSGKAAGTRLLHNGTPRGPRAGNAARRPAP